MSSTLIFHYSNGKKYHATDVNKSSLEMTDHSIQYETTKFFENRVEVKKVTVDIDESLLSISLHYTLNGFRRVELIDFHGKTVLTQDKNTLEKQHAKVVEMENIEHKRMTHAKHVAREEIRQSKRNNDIEYLQALSVDAPTLLKALAVRQERNRIKQNK